MNRRIAGSALIVLSVVLPCLAVVMFLKDGSTSRYYGFGVAGLPLLIQGLRMIER